MLPVGYHTVYAYLLDDTNAHVKSAQTSFDIWDHSIRGSEKEGCSSAGAHLDEVHGTKKADFKVVFEGKQTFTFF